MTRLLTLLAVLNILAVPGLYAADLTGPSIEVCFVEQYSPMFKEWHRVVCFYGFGLNREMAEKFVDAFKSNSERPLRIVAVSLPKKKLKAFEEFGL